MSFKSNYFPMNSFAEDPNQRGASPMVVQMIDFSETLVAGESEMDNVASDIAVADIIGTHVYHKSGDIKGDITGLLEITAGTVSGLKITITSSLATSTADKVGTIALLGRLTPTYS